MSHGGGAAHPYIPNAAEPARQAMLERIGVADIEELYSSIPQELRLGGPLDLPPAMESELELRRHVTGLLDRNRPATHATSFLGAGCYQHYVPAICGEINGRGEFLTAYAGEPYEDHGKWQAIFEYTSLMAEILEMDVVSVPNYDGFQAASTSLRMAVRMTGRSRVLVSSSVLPDKLLKIESYLEGAAEVVSLPVSRETGSVDLGALDRLLGQDIAAVYVETPNGLGVIETQLAHMAERVHRDGALLVCGVEPLSLGFQRSPAASGADILCGDIQSLGLGMHFGGAHGGFIASHDEEAFVYEFPTRLFGIVPTDADGEIGFSDVAYERTSLAMRDSGIEWVGTAAALWGITAGVYLSLLGSAGLRTVGHTVAANTRYAIDRLSRIQGVEVPHAASPHWREFVVRYTDASAPDVDAILRESDVFGGVIFTEDRNGLGEYVLVSVTEVHTTSDIDRLAELLEATLIP